jgi:hypothetical protein
MCELENRVSDLEKLEKLEEGEECEVNWSEGGGGLVTRTGDSYLLKYVPQYGGNPATQGIYTKHELEKIIEIVGKWT